MLNGLFLKTRVCVHQKGGSVHLQPRISKWLGASKHLHLLSYIHISFSFFWIRFLPSFPVLMMVKAIYAQYVSPILWTKIIYVLSWCCIPFTFFLKDKNDLWQTFSFFFSQSTIIPLWCFPVKVNCKHLVRTSTANGNKESLKGSTNKLKVTRSTIQNFIAYVFFQHGQIYAPFINHTAIELPAHNWNVILKWSWHFLCPPNDEGLKTRNDFPPHCNQNEKKRTTH